MTVDNLRDPFGLVETDFLLMAPSVRSKSVGVLTAIFVGLLLPLTWVYAIPAWGINSIVILTSRRTAGRGLATAISSEQYTSLVIIPVVGLIATTGTGAAFFALSDAESPLWLQENAVSLLVFALLISVELIWLSVRTISRHQSGIEVLPFENGVDPAMGIARLLDIRVSKPHGLISARQSEAAKCVDEMPIEVLATPGAQVSVRLGFSLLLRGMAAARAQSGILGLASIAWLLFGGLAVAHVTPLLAGWTILLVIAGAIVAYTLYLVSSVQMIALRQIRLKSRACELAKLRDAACEESSVGARSIQHLFVEVDRLVDRVDALVLLLEKVETRAFHASWFRRNRRTPR